LRAASGGGCLSGEDRGPRTWGVFWAASVHERSVYVLSSEAGSIHKNTVILLFSETGLARADARVWWCEVT
jgi:hypothetical protein